MPKNWNQYSFSLIVLILLPLIPMLIEFWIKGMISDETYSIIATSYSISIGVSSKNLAVLGLGIFSAMAFSCVFGSVLIGHTTAFSVAGPALVAIGGFSLTQIFERFARHVAGTEMFIDLGGEE